MARDLNIKGTAGIVDSDQYVYRKERDISKTMVDWGQAAKDITQTITDIRDDRAAQKEDLAKQTRERMNELAKFEQYDSQTLNTKIIGASNEAGNFVQMQNDLMRRGLISPSEFLQSTQQISDNFSQLKTATKGWDAHYKQAMARLETDPKTGKPTANALEQFINEGMAGFGNLANLDLVVNPTTGTMSFVKKGDDFDDPANHQSLNTINARMNQKSNYVDLSKGVQAEVEKLGEVVTADYLSDKGVETFEDWYELEGNEELMNDMIKTQMATDEQKISIMQDHVDGFELTRTPDDPRLKPKLENGKPNPEYNPDLVLVTPNPDGSGAVQPNFTDEQNQKMAEIVGNRFRAQIDQKAGFTPGKYAPQKGAAAYAADERKQERLGYVEEFNTMLTGDPKQANAMFQRRITTTNKEREANGLPLIDPSQSVITENYAELIYDDGSTERIEFSGNVMQDIVSLSDNLVPEDARVNQRQLEKYVDEEGIIIGEYATEEREATQEDVDAGRATEVGEKITVRSKRDVRSKGGIKPIKVIGNNLVVTADGQKLTYKKYFANNPPGNTLGPDLNSAVDKWEDVERGFKGLVDSPGFIPKQLKTYLEKNNLPIDVKVNKTGMTSASMTVQIGDQTLYIDDVYANNPKIGKNKETAKKRKKSGTRGMAEMIRELVVQAAEKYNKERAGGGGEGTETKSGGNVR